MGGTPSLAAERHLFQDIGLYPLPEPQDVGQDVVDVLAVGPDFVGPAGHGLRKWAAREAVPVEPEQGAPHPVLEPADDQLAVLRVARVTSVEAADVR